MLNAVRIWFGSESNDPVSRALSLVDQAQSSYRTAEICKNQAECLASSFKKIGEQLGTWHPHLVQSQRYSSNPLSMQELLFALDKGLQLLKSCKKNGWVVRTLLRAESRQEFKEIHCSLLESMKLVRTSLLNGIHAEDLILVSEENLDNAADRDMRHLCELSCELQLMLQAILQGNHTVDSDEVIARELMIEYEDMKLIRHLGQGNFGTVFEAKWRNHSVAVKVLRGGSFKKEMSIVSFKHPNIVSVLGYSFEKEREENCIVMEKMDKDLALVIRKRVRKSPMKSPFQLRVSVSIMLQVATGMRFLHSKGVIHRDLKTENILVADLSKLEQNLVVKIGDFGNSRANFATQVGDYSPSQGTPGFRAPEVYRSEHYSRKADVFSYAMVCYHILAGKQAFEGSDNAVQRDQRLRGGQRPNVHDDWDEKLKSLLQSCWQQNPDDRPSFLSICSSLHSIRSNICCEARK